MLDRHGHESENRRVAPYKRRSGYQLLTDGLAAPGDESGVIWFCRATGLLLIALVRNGK